MTIPYLAYGSNTDPARLARYLEDGWRAPPARPVRVPGWTLRFQGVSRRWGGSPVALVPAPEGVVLGVVYDLAVDDLVTVVRREARAPASSASRAVEALADLTGPDRVGIVAPGTQYTHVVRLPVAPSGALAVTVDPDRLLALGAPAPDYLATIRRGLGGWFPSAVVDAHLAAAQMTG